MMNRALAAAALICAAPGVEGTASVASDFSKNNEGQICSHGNQITSASVCQQAGEGLDLKLTTTEVQTQNTASSAVGCYYLNIPARRSDTGSAVRQLWFNSNTQGTASADQYPLCGAASAGASYGIGKYHCHMAYCIESEHGTFSKEECYEAQQNGCKAPPTFAPTKFPTRPMPEVKVVSPTYAPTEGYANPCNSQGQECEQLCYPHTGDNCVDFSAPGARSFDAGDSSSSTGAVSDTVCVPVRNGAWGRAEPSTCRLQRTVEGGKIVTDSGAAGRDFRSATFASDYVISLKDCKAACDMLNKDANCYAIEHDTKKNTCQLITNSNVRALPPCDPYAYTCSCKEGFTVDPIDARKCKVAAPEISMKSGAGQPCGFVDQAVYGNSGTLVSCPSLRDEPAYFCDYSKQKWGHCVECSDVPSENGAHVCADDSRLNAKGESECKATCEPAQIRAVAVPTRPPTMAIREVQAPLPVIYAHAKKPTLTRVLNTHTDFSIFEHYLSIAPGGEYMLYKEMTQCHHDELIITARQCQIAAEAMNLPVTTEKNGIKFEYVQVERKSSHPRGCYYKVDPKAGVGQLPKREIWFNTADYGAGDHHKKPICVRSLLSTLSNKATSIPYSIFAPTDEAFLAFFKENPEMKDRLNDNPEVLVQLLLEHVIDGPKILPVSESTTMRLTSEARLCLTPECQSDSEMQNICGRETDAACPSDFYCNYDMAEYGHCRACLENCNAGMFGKGLLDCQSNCQPAVRVVNTQICSATQKCAMHMSRVPFCDFDAGTTGHCRQCMNVPEKDCASMSDLNAGGKAECATACESCFMKGNCQGMDIVHVHSGFGTGMSANHVGSTSIASAIGGFGSIASANSGSYNAKTTVNQLNSAGYSGSVSSGYSSETRTEKAYEAHQAAVKSGEYGADKHGGYGGNARMCGHDHPCGTKHFCDFNEATKGVCISCGMQVSCHGHGMTQDGEDSCRSACDHDYDGADDDYHKDKKFLRHETRTKFDEGMSYSHHARADKSKYTDDDGETGQKKCNSDHACVGYGASGEFSGDRRDGEGRFGSSKKEGDDRRLLGTGSFCNFDHDEYGHCVVCEHVTSCANMIYSKGAQSCRKVCKGDSGASPDDDAMSARSSDKYTGAAPEKTHEYAPPTTVTHVAKASEQREYSSGHMSSPKAVYSAPIGGGGGYEKGSDAYAPAQEKHDYAAQPTIPYGTSHEGALNLKTHTPEGYYGQGRSGSHGELEARLPGYGGETGPEGIVGGRCSRASRCGGSFFCDFKEGAAGNCESCEKVKDCKEHGLGVDGVAACEDCSRSKVTLLNTDGYTRRLTAARGGENDHTCGTESHHSCHANQFCDFEEPGLGKCKRCDEHPCSERGLTIQGVSECNSVCEAEASRVCALSGPNTCAQEEFCNFIEDVQGKCQSCTSVDDCTKMGFTANGIEDCAKRCRKQIAHAAAAAEAIAVAASEQKCDMTGENCGFQEFCDFHRGKWGKCKACFTEEADHQCKHSSFRERGVASCTEKCTDAGVHSTSSGAKSSGADDDDASKDAVAAVTKHLVTNDKESVTMLGHHHVAGFTLNHHEAQTRAKSNYRFQKAILNSATCHGYTHSDTGLHGCLAMCTDGSKATPHHQDDDARGTRTVGVHSDDDDRGKANAHPSFAEHAHAGDDDSRRALNDGYARRRLRSAKAADYSASVAAGYGEGPEVKAEESGEGYEAQSSKGYVNHADIGAAPYQAPGLTEKTAQVHSASGADDDDLPAKAAAPPGECSTHAQCGESAFCDMGYANHSPIDLDNDLLGARTKMQLKNAGVDDHDFDRQLRAQYGLGDLTPDEEPDEPNGETRAAAAAAMHMSGFSDAYQQAGIRGRSSSSNSGPSTHRGRCVTCASLATKVKNSAGDDDSVYNKNVEHKGDDDLLQTRGSTGYGSKVRGSSIGSVGYDNGASVRTAYHLNHNGHLFYKHTESVFLDTDQHKPVPFTYIRTQRQNCARPARVRRTPHFTNMGVVFKTNGVLLPPALCMATVKATVTVQTVTLPVKKQALSGEWCGAATDIATAFGNVQQCTVMPGNGAESFYCNYEKGSYGICEPCGGSSRSAQVGPYGRTLSAEMNCNTLSSSAGSLAMESCLRACGRVVQQRVQQPIMRVQRLPPPPLVVEQTCGTRWLTLIIGILLILVSLSMCGRDVCCFPLCGSEALALQLMCRTSFDGGRSATTNIGNCMAVEMFLGAIFFIIYSFNCHSMVWLGLGILMLLTIFLACCCMKTPEPMIESGKIESPAAPMIMNVPQPFTAQQPFPGQQLIVQPLRATPPSPALFDNSQWNQQPNSGSRFQTTDDGSGNIRTQMF